MSKLSILAHLLSVLREASERLPGVKWYGFGSFFNTAGMFGDIDLLVVFVDESEKFRIRSVVDEVTLELPIHLLIMSIAEVNETEFIARQKCRSIF